MTHIKRFLTKNNFKAWLESKSLKTKVGKPAEPCGCPIFNFLRNNEFQMDKLTYKVTDVFTDHVTLRSKIYDDTFIFYLPKWAMDFVQKTDNYHDSIKYITAKKALIMLGEK